MCAQMSSNLPSQLASPEQPPPAPGLGHLLGLPMQSPVKGLHLSRLHHEILVGVLKKKSGRERAALAET